MPGYTRRPCLFLFLTIFILMSSGCAGVGQKLEPPRIHITNVQVQELKALEAVFEIEFRIFNTNDTPLEIKGIDCDLELNDKHFATGVSDKEAKIPSLGTGTMTLLLYSSLLDMVKSIWGLPGKEKIQYTLKGRVHVDSASPGPSVMPFKSEGELSIEDFTPGQ